MASTVERVSIILEFNDGTRKQFLRTPEAIKSTGVVCFRGRYFTFQRITFGDLKYPKLFFREVDALFIAEDEGAE